MTNIAILASGNGSNAQRIIEYFVGSADIKVAIVISNKEDAYVRQRARTFGIKEVYVSRSDFDNPQKISRIFYQYRIDWIILAGFIQLIPPVLIKEFNNRIINIHPALLPKYGGKGMYGMHVHESVIANKDKTSGITVHFVNEVYDDGEIIFQTTCKVNADDTPESLAEKIHELEYEHYPKVIEDLIR